MTNTEEGLKILEQFDVKLVDEENRIYLCGRSVPIHLRYKLAELGWIVKADRITFISPDGDYLK